MTKGNPETRRSKTGNSENVTRMSTIEEKIDTSESVAVSPTENNFLNHLCEITTLLQLEAGQGSVEAPSLYEAGPQVSEWENVSQIHQPVGDHAQIHCESRTCRL